MTTRKSVDCILVGGGLSNALIALGLLRARPDLDILILERGASIGGNHTWSFHSSDIEAENMGLVAPLIVYSWPDQEVRFPQFTRILDTGYNSVTSDRLHDIVCERLGGSVRFGCDVTDVGANVARLATGEEFEGALVIDGRGMLRDGAWKLGYQKFLGLEVELEAPCDQPRPIIMDATVAQIDGYRFVYTMPFTPTRLLIEDTYYSPTAALDTDRLETDVRAYAAEKGWRIKEVLRREAGVLPIVLWGDISRLWGEFDAAAPARAGLRAYLFHPTTGYSLPDATRLAALIAGLRRLDTQTVAAAVRRMSEQAWQSRTFYRMLNRLLFLAAKPHQRVDVMQRFYTLPEDLVRRFYACSITSVDKAKILIGRPPISVISALRTVAEPSAPAA